jgi:lipoprotein-anchoring transpeptidase ErfK/SrfK
MAVERRGRVFSIACLAVAAAHVFAAGGPRARQTAAPLAAVSDISPVLGLQVRLDRAGFSPGEIDGVSGANTRRALRAFGRARQIDPADPAAVAAAANVDAAAVLTEYVITASDAAGPFVPAIPETPAEQAALPALSYRSVIELIGERTHVAPALLRKLNPAAAFIAGETIRVPATRPAPPAPAPGAAATPPAAARVVVSRTESGLTVYDQAGAVIFFAPVTSGSEHDPLPLGSWAVTAVVRHPTFQYNPVLFWDAEPGDTRMRLPAGPNGPVGTIWIDLTKPHYGIHGTPEPGEVGHRASHGCVRLTNWDAETLASLVGKGTPVIFDP